MDRFQWARFVLENSDAATRADRLAVLHRLAPGDADAWKEIGKLHFVAMNQPDAEAAWRKALQLRPGFAEAWVNLGWLYDSQGRAEDSLGALVGATRCDPSCADAWERLGILHISEGRRDEAAEAFRKLADQPHRFSRANLSFRTSRSRLSRW